MEEALRGETLPHMIERLWNSISGFATVETSGARTTVAWSGDFTTIVEDPKQLPLHRIALEDALARRQDTLRIVAAGISAASTLALASANPLAVPAAIRACRELAHLLR